MADDDVSDVFQYRDEFKERMIRHAFIRRVYSIVMLQMAVTTLIIALCCLVPSIRIFVILHPALFWTSFAIYVVLLLLIFCVNTIRYKYPNNVIALGILTLAMGYMVGYITAHYKITVVLMAFGLTTVMCFALTIFAFQTKCDFTACSGIMFLITICLLVAGVIGIFWWNKIYHILYATAGVIIFGIWLVIDTQMMMGGNHRFSLNPNDYVEAALNIYIDIIQIFLHLLALIGWLDS